MAGTPLWLHLAWAMYSLESTQAPLRRKLLPLDLPLDLPACAGQTRASTSAVLRSIVPVSVDAV